ncbi:hypothetical protein [Nocardioides panzhihuensis]|uniref:YtxH domain-containing protein n=1 Tax=Nocardioides panzhihuensis TaxID=860243 RepID=A0A7Z0ISQ4_9ACTN|nr:hypothetical protein [Nocardioides panzhihuensis]NYI78110.1 hypothetical protein [Nocardioides panzhihuensis]
MFKKPALLTAFGIGYLLGARAGRERYDAIVAKAQGLWQDPRVQEKAQHARVVAEETAETAKHSVQDKMPGHGSSTTSTTSTSSHQTTPSAPTPAASADPVTGTPRGWES